MSKSSCDSNNVEIKLKRKRRKRKSSKQNVKQVDSDVSRANSDFVHFSDLDIFGSVRRPKNSGVIWKKKWSSNTSNVGLAAVSVPNLNKNIKRYSRKDLLAYLDIFGSVRRPKNSGVIWKKKWIIDSGCSKHMTGNRALLTNFVEKFLGTVRFGNNDFAMIAGYGDVIIGSMTIKKVYYVEDHLRFACEQGKIHRKHHKSKTTFASNKPLYLLHMDLCGPMRVQSINGKRYVLVVVDNYSRYT
nr:spindle assembly checkpoint component MAD1-like [Tanacetum cinerariifolium]